MSAAVSGFGAAGAAGAAGLIAPVASDAASAGGMSFGTALLSALAADPGTSNPTTPAHPSPSADAGSAETPAETGAATPPTVAPAPAPAAPAVQEAVTSTAPDAGSHGKQPASPRAGGAELRHDAVSPAIADALGVGQLAVQQAMNVAQLPVAPIPADTSAAAPAAAPASSAAVDGVAGPSAPPAPAPTPARDASAQPIEPATVSAGAQPPAAPLATAPARPTSKTPSGPSAPVAESATVSTATPMPAQAPAAPTFATALAAAAPAAPAASTAPAPAPPLQQQLAQPVMTLARQPDGDHVVVVRVAPDDLGPVTVHARVSDTGVHIELFAPSDDGREAIRQILTDLRRDLNATTANASVSVSDQNAPGAQSDGGGRSQWASADERGSATTADSLDEQAPAPRDIPVPARVLPGARTLDIVV